MTFCKFGLGSIACVFLVGCIAMPDSVLERKATEALAVPQEFQAATVDQSNIIDGLIDLFDDNTLSKLVEQALEHNLDIRLAAKQLQTAGYEARAEWGNVVPEVTGAISTDVSKEAQKRPASTFAPTFDVGWEIDLWAKLRDQQAAREATALARAEAASAARDSIAAQVMQGWFDAVAAEQRVELEALRLDNLRKILTNNRRQYEAGLAPLADVAAIKRDIAQTNARLAAESIKRNRSCGPATSSWSCCDGAVRSPGSASVHSAGTRRRLPSGNITSRYSRSRR